MSTLRRVWARLLRTVRGGDFEREMDEEMRQHVELETAERIRLGQSPAEARRTALRDFGGIGRQKEAARAVRGFAWLDDFGQDLRFALRGLRRSPGASLAAVATLGLGVGAATVTVSAVQGILFEPMPYRSPDRIVVAWEANSLRKRWANSVAVTNFEAWVARTREFAALAALVPDQQVLDRGRPDRVTGAAVSPSWFTVTGVSPALGRAFTDVEASGGAAVMVLSDELWRDGFGGDPSVIGRAVQFQDHRMTVVGVMPRGFRPPAFGWIGPNQKYWIPFAPAPANRPWGRSLLVMGRLKPGATIDDARGELGLVMEQLAREAPDANRGWSATVRSLREEIVGDVKTPLLVLLVAVAGLLGTTIVNLVAITLARLRRRESELAVRLALGAGRPRVARQLVAEAVALALVAAPLGLVLAWLGIAGIQAIHPVSLPRAENVRMDLAMAGVAAALTIGATMIAGLCATVRLGRIGLRGSIDASGTRTTRRAAGGRLVTIEVAVALVLTIGAALAMRSFVNLRRTALGFEPDQVTALRVSLPSLRYDDGASRAFYQDLERRLAASPGIERIGFVSVRPLGGTRVATTVFPADRRLEKKDAPVADIRVASAGFFRALSIPFIAGRYPEVAAPGAESPIIITRSLADALWPGRTAVGQRVLINLNEGIAARVVALVPDARLNGPTVEPRPTAYFPFESRAERDLDLVVRSSAPAQSVGRVVQDVVSAMDSSLPVYAVESIEGLLRDAMAGDRVTFVLLAGFSLVAVLLASVGVAGVLLVEVGDRRRELGVRMALGAGAAEVRGAVVRSGIRLAATGVAIGLVGAAYLTRFMRSLLHGVSPADPVSFVGVSVALLLVALLATFLPAHRATRVDPLEILRSD
jgi:putative ABC transport system permease protein